MPLVSGGGGAAFNGGTITQALEVDSGAPGTAILKTVNAAGQTQDALQLLDSAQGSGTFIKSSGAVWIEPSGHDQPANVVGGPLLLVDLSSLDAGATFTGNLMVIAALTGATVAAISNEGAYKVALHAAPASGNIAAGECALWFDQTNGAAKLMLKGKTADGTVVTASVALA